MIFNVVIQNALELIMSKYRQHVTRLVNCPKPDFQGLNNRNIQVSQSSLPTSSLHTNVFLRCWQRGQRKSARWRPS